MTLKEKISHSKKILKEFEPPEGYYFCFSGGKDSVVCLDLLLRAKVKFQTFYNITTIEHPETLDFVKQFPNINYIEPKSSIVDLIRKKGFPPTIRYRYCTSELKVVHGRNRLKVMGIRAAESAKRKARYQEVNIDSKRDNYVLPLFNWLDKDIWEYIGKYNLPYHPLYNEGYKRVGCMLCPFAPKWQFVRELNAYPDAVQSYYLACVDSYNQKKMEGKKFDTFSDGEDIFLWWLRTVMRDDLIRLEDIKCLSTLTTG